MSSTEPNESQQEAIGLFCGITGADEERARGLLEACDWNLQLAINMHVDTDPDGRSNRNASQLNPSSSHRINGGANEEEDGEDGSDDESAGRMGRFATRNNRSVNHQAIRRFGAGTSSSDPLNPPMGPSLDDIKPDSDGVRPPIAPIRQILNPNPIGFPSPDVPLTRRHTRGGPVAEVFDAFRDFQAEANYQEMLQGEGEEAAETSGNRRMTLQQLFRPPLELMFRGSLTSAREAGQEQNKWLLVNIQNGAEFNCQVLNRDVWSHQAVKDIIKGNFIFWQVYHDSYEGQRFVQFYHVPVNKLPYVAIIDPRTGELMKSWPTSIDHTSFCDSVTEYLLDHPSPDGTSGDANTMKKIRFKEDANEVNADEDDEPQILATRTTLYDQSEEAQLEAAIRASLKENEKLDTCEDTIEIDEDTVSVSSDQNKSSTNNNNSSASTAQETHKTIAEALSAMAGARDQTKIEGPECKIALRFPDGSSLMQKFAASEKLKDVRNLVQMEKSAFKSAQIEFVAPPNRKLTVSMMDETLESLGLCPASRLEVKCVQD
uniref:UBX domain-containing protein 7 n=1 Tax=Aceria tosichella TaxID=561515 RepID=A0A6G1SPY4_9ACAR